MLTAYLYGGLRSPFGRHAGAIAGVRPDDLAATVLKQTLAASSFRAEQLDDVLLGCVTQCGEDSRNVARNALLLAGVPFTVPGQTINRLCASGLAAVAEAARSVTCGEGELFLVGGVESMSRAPFVLGKAETAFGREQKLFDSTIGPRFPNAAITRLYGAHTMPETGDNVAAEFGISREDADRFAAASQSKYAAAKAAGFYAGEICPIEVGTRRKGPPTVVTEDEHPRPDVTMESLSAMKPLFEGGIVTAGNASGINDGAAALFVGSRLVGDRAGAKPLARILASAATGVEPRIMGIGPSTAIPKALDRCGLSLKDLDLIEINEAFASQVLACLKLLGMERDDPRVNPNGGAIAIGHPLGASGARLAITAARQLERCGGRYAAVSLCVGVGQGLAIIIERV